MVTSAGDLPPPLHALLPTANARVCCSALLPLYRPTLYIGHTLFILLHPVQGRRVTDVRNTSNMDGWAVSQLKECFGWKMAGASVA